MKRWCTAALALLCCLVFRASGAEAASDVRGYDKKAGYQYVRLGTYPYSKKGAEKAVLWRVLSVSQGKALLLSEYVLDAYPAIVEEDPAAIREHIYRRIKSYKQSDLYQYMNTQMLQTLLGSDPVQNALVSTKAGGKLFPLSEKQINAASLGFVSGDQGDQASRSAAGTPWAIAVRGLRAKEDGQLSPYWIAALKDGESDDRMRLVEDEGRLDYAEMASADVGIRPALQLDLTQLSVASGKGTKKDPFILEMIEAAPQRSSALLSFVGDCSMGDISLRPLSLPKSYHSVVAREGYAWPFSRVIQYLRADDFTVANLEVVLTTKTKSVNKRTVLRGVPEHVNVLLEGSVEAVNTVNNHCMDYLEAGYQDTLKTLDAAGVKRFGSYNYTKKEGYDDLLVQQINCIKFGFMGFSYPIQDSTVKYISERISKLKKDMGCDVVIVSLHWGRETHMTPESWQYTIAQKIIDAGADMIYGHHPHVLQPIFFYKNKPILFSLGNFTFGSMSDVDKRTCIVQTSYEMVDGKAVLRQLQVIPCRTAGSNDYRPFEVTAEEDRAKVFKALRLSKTCYKCEPAPESFLKTGIVQLNEKGEIIR